ncbi:HD domain-containing protein [Actinocrispum sp. NPDC049592]|uniref:HD domain-containing protein n=1 Tax=Actinocrispum sp. NPDC049592 TaxID=3154835 RepID=UPI003418BFE3
MISDGFRELPEQAKELLHDASPRLVAHLRAVHDVAWQIADWVGRVYPAAGFDREAVLFGAATHDIGKIIYVAELSGPGSEHEQAGYELLLSKGVPARLARFARTHSAWTPDIELDDLLVSLADKIWKGKRVQDLEQLVTERLAASTGQPVWEVFMGLDDFLDHIAAGAEARLAFQAAHPVTT